MATVYKSLSKKSASADSSAVAEAPTNGVQRSKANKQRVLILSSRGVTYRHRHLLQDLANLIPHGRKDAKWDSKSKLFQLNELAELYNCNNVMYFEARKNQDLYLWLARAPNGPTVKFHCQNIHTMSELNFVGNCLKGSRPVLSFDGAFDNEPHLQVIKALFTAAFGVPQGARKSKPFVDHVMGFSIADGKIWVRNYQITESQPSDKKSETDEGEDEKKKSKTKGHGKEKEFDVSLVEIGPRFCLDTIIIQEGSFSGPLIYENKNFVSPNQVRADIRKRKATKHNARAEQFVERTAKRGDLGLRTHGGKKMPMDELDSKVLFA
ncbi:Brix-domain-containing protein [Xylariaceae sp. FL0016]|nr:Brix-domain-containing protein [Xylariaceae sp. FL0016]